MVWVSVFFVAAAFIAAAAAEAQRQAAEQEVAGAYVLAEPGGGGGDGGGGVFANELSAFVGRGEELALTEAPLGEGDYSLIFDDNDFTSMQVSDFTSLQVRPARGLLLPALPSVL
jgi:hypothetical protein